MVPMSSERERLDAAIAALEAQRQVLGDAVAETALAPLRARLATLVEVPTVPAAANQTLRQATILFVDVAGSTKLSQKLGPEELHVRMIPNALCTQVSRSLPIAAPQTATSIPGTVLQTLSFVSVCTPVTFCSVAE